MESEKTENEDCTVTVLVISTLVIFEVICEHLRTDSMKEQALKKKVSLRQAWKKNNFGVKEL